MLMSGLLCLSITCRTSGNIYTQLWCAEICSYTAALVDSLERGDAVRAGVGSALLRGNFLHACMVRTGMCVFHQPHGPRSCVHSGLCFRRRTGGSSKRKHKANSKQGRCSHSETSTPTTMSFKHIIKETVWGLLCTYPVTNITLPLMWIWGLGKEERCKSDSLFSFFSFTLVSLC